MQKMLRIHACPRNIGIQTIVKNQLTASCEARVIRPKMMCDSPHGSLTNLFLRLNSKRSRGRYCNHSSLELSPGIKFVQLVEKLLVLFVAFCTLALQKRENNWSHSTQEAFSECRAGRENIKVASAGIWAFGIPLPRFRIDSHPWEV